MIQRSRFCSMPERTAKSQEQMSKSCWVSAQPVLHDASGTWLRVNSSGRSEKQEISDTPHMTHSIIESPTAKSWNTKIPQWTTFSTIHCGRFLCLRPMPPPSASSLHRPTFFSPSIPPMIPPLHHRSTSAHIARKSERAPPGSRWRFILNTDPGQF